MTARHPDAIGALAIVVIAILVIVGGLTTPDPGFGVVSPATFPVIIGALMFASAVWLLKDSLGAALPALDAIDWRPFLGTIAATFGFLVAFVPLGFLLTATPFLVIQSRLLGSRSLIRDIIASLVFIAAIYTLFVRFLTIDLPRGPLPAIF